MEEQPISAEPVDGRGPGRWLGALSCRGCLLVVYELRAEGRLHIFFVNLAELRMIHDNTQHLLVDERRLRCGVAVEVSHSGKVNNVRKWYSQNNCRPWCLKEAAENAMQVCVGWADRAFLHGLTTSTDGLSGLLPASCGKAWCEEIAKPHETASSGLEGASGRFAQRG